MELKCTFWAHVQAPCQSDPLSLESPPAGGDEGCRAARGGGEWAAETGACRADPEAGGAHVCILNRADLCDSVQAACIAFSEGPGTPAPIAEAPWSEVLLKISGFTPQQTAGGPPSQPPEAVATARAALSPGPGPCEGSRNAMIIYNN